MKYTATERIGIMGLIHGEGDYEYLKLHRSIFDKTKFTKKEIKDGEMSMNGNGGVNFKSGKVKDVKIEYTDIEKQLIKDKLLELNENKSLKNDLFEVYEKFVVSE